MKSQLIQGHKVSVRKTEIRVGSKYVHCHTITHCVYVSIAKLSETGQSQ